MQTVSAGQGAGAAALRANEKRNIFNIGAGLSCRAPKRQPSRAAQVMMRCSITVLTWPHALLKGPRLGGFVRRHVPRPRASRFQWRAAAQEKDGMAENELPE